MALKRFSQIKHKDDRSFEGDSITMEEVLNKDIDLMAFKIGPSKQERGIDCLTMQIVFNGEKRVIFTGSSVLMDKCKEYEEELPFTVQITKIGRYFTFKEEENEE